VIAELNKKNFTFWLTYGLSLNLGLSEKMTSPSAHSFKVLIQVWLSIVAIFSIQPVNKSF